MERGLKKAANIAALVVFFALVFITATADFKDWVVIIAVIITIAI